jgi:hypothetical protein
MKINYLIDLSSKNKNLSNIFKIKYCLHLIKKTVSKKFFVAFSSSLLIMISSCAFDDGYSSYVPNKPRSLNYNNPYDFVDEYYQDQDQYYKPPKIINDNDQAAVSIWDQK